MSDLPAFVSRLRAYHLPRDDRSQALRRRAPRFRRRDELRRLPPARARAGRAAAALGQPQRAAVHRAAPGLRAVAQAHDPRAHRRARSRCGLRPAAGVQDARAGGAHHGAAEPVLGRALHAHPCRVLGLSRSARRLVGLPVVPVPHGGVPPRQQARRDDGAPPAPPRALRLARCPLPRPVPLRRGAAAARAPRLRPRSPVRRARLDHLTCLRRIGTRCLGRGVPRHRGALGALRARRETGGPGGCLPPVALPPRDDRRTHHRAEARHRRDLGGGLPARGPRGGALPRALARAHGAVMASEIELKLELAPKAHAAFRRLPALAGAAARTTRLKATYFDTPEFGLRGQEMALRLRSSGRRWTQTLKAGRSGAGGLHAREEWEFARPGATLDTDLLADTPLAAEPALVRNLGEVFKVDVRRTTWEVEVSPGNRVEVALDRGEVRHGERSEAVSEVEIESVAGDPLAVFEFADRLVGPETGDVPSALRPSAVTKAQRGYRLARGEPLAPVRASPAALVPSMSPTQAARAMAAAALEQLQANEAGVLVGEDPEYLHQFRVALRRLRSALGVFRAAGGALDDALREELRWIAHLTGPARDWDVLVIETLPTLLAAYRGGRAARTVRMRAAARRGEANAQLRKAIASARYVRLVLALARWLAVPAPDPALEPQGDAETLADF